MINLRIIELSDFTEYKFLTQNMELEELQPVIDEAGRFDIQPLLGPEMYYDLLNNQTAQKYIDLVNGKVYTPSGGSAPVEFAGLKQILKYYVYARLLVLDGVKSTASGFVKKVLENSERVPSTQLSQMVTQAKSGAKNFERDMICYLNNFASTYPLWKCGTNANQGTSFRINAI